VSAEGVFRSMLSGVKKQLYLTLPFISAALERLLDR